MLASQSSGFGFSEDMLDMDCLREIHCKIADLNSEKDLYIVTRKIDLFRFLDGFPRKPGAETVPGLEAVNAERPDAELWAELEAGTGTGDILVLCCLTSTESFHKSS